MDANFLVTLLLQYRYGVMVPAALFLGPIVGLVAGSLVRTGFLDFFPSLLAIASGALIGDVIWYWVGYHHGERFASRTGKYVGITDAHVATAKHLFNLYHMRILFISKITAGLGFAIVILFTAGLSRVPFGRFLLVNIAGESIWSSFLLGVGFFISNFIIRVNSVFEWISIAGLMVVFMLCLVGVGNYVRTYVTAKSNEKSNSPPQSV